VLYPTVAEVHQAFLRGKTVILTATQHRWPAAAALVAATSKRSSAAPSMPTRT